MSSGTTVEWLAGIRICNWFLDSLSMSHFNTSPSITEYWLAMMSVLKDLLILICLRSYRCPHHYEFRNYSGVAWWYMHSQLVSVQLEYITLHYKCFHLWVLARNDVSFARFPDLDPSKNILLSTPLWVQEIQWSGLLVYAFAIGFWTVRVYYTSIQVLPSMSIGKEWCQFWQISWFGSF